MKRLDYSRDAIITYASAKDGWRHVAILPMALGGRCSGPVALAAIWRYGDMAIWHIRVAQTAFILFSTFLDLRPASDASD
jgi:hypothetical protein